MSHLHDDAGASVVVDAILWAPFLCAAVLYVAAAVREGRRGRPWPWYRVLLWIVGLAAAASGFAGPLPHAAHDAFTAHMAAHLLVGMLAPLLLALAAPVTLALRALAVVPARRLSRMLRSPVARTLTSPAVAALLNIGGMWAVYRTPLFGLMQEDWLVHVLVMLHLLLAGYLYTSALIGVDPSPHRGRFAVRAAVLVASLAAHGALAKVLYSSPLPGVATADARSGAQLMFYGGDAVEFVLILLVCAEWYRVTGSRLQREHGGALAGAFKGEVS